MKRIIAVLLTVLMIATVMTACSGNAGSDTKTVKKSFKVGICNYVDHASLNQIVDNVKSGLSKLGKENDVEFEILSENCNASPSYSRRYPIPSASSWSATWRLPAQTSPVHRIISTPTPLWN